MTAVDSLASMTERNPEKKEISNLNLIHLGPASVGSCQSQQYVTHRLELPWHCTGLPGAVSGRSLFMTTHGFTVLLAELGRTWKCKVAYLLVWPGSVFPPVGVRFSIYGLAADYLPCAFSISICRLIL